MRLLVYDFETFYSQEFTLRKMSPAEYILDPRFEALGSGFKWGEEDPFWVDKPDLPRFFASVDWSDVFAVAHSALFDACILKWVYDVSPAMLGDTLAMMRNWWSYITGDANLASMARHVGIPPKMGTLARTYGKTYDAICADPMLLAELREYGPDDCRICHDGFKMMLEEGFPQNQLAIIDRQVRMCTEPQFVVDQNVLTQYHAQVLAEKSQLLAEVGMTLDDKSGLMSNQQLALLLMAHGVTPPMKRSPTTGKETFAFAKTDKEFEDLLDHESPAVQAIVAARLGVKSTIEETRTARYISIGNLPWPPWMRPQSMPIPLKYSGAHTHRFSGDWTLNAQNLGRASEIRKGLKAPDGHSVVSADASQVEARLTATLARWVAKLKGGAHSNLVHQFEAGEDVYSSFASEVYGFPVDKLKFPTERFVGKTGVLSLGYGSSWPVFQAMVRNKGGGTVISDLLAIRTVETYRKRYPEIPLLWRYADDMISFMASAPEGSWKEWGPLWVGHEVIVLPNGNRLNYRELHQEVNDEGRVIWVYKFGKRIKYLYGAKVVENVIQAMAFVLIMEADRRIKELTRGLLKLAHQVHDEIIYVVPNHLALMVARLAVQEISRRPDWMPDCPLAAEGKIGGSYGGVVPVKI